MIKKSLFYEKNLLNRIILIIFAYVISTELKLNGYGHWV